MSHQYAGGAPARVRRYSGSARINHWLVAISFIILMLTGLAFFHPSLYPLTALFGGGATARWLHPIAGLVLFVSFLGLFLRFFVSNLPEGTDAVWLARFRHVLAGREEYLPEVGKYNAGQKFVFWAQAILICVLLVTGLGLWEQSLVYVQQYTGFKATIEHKRLAAVVHAGAAVVTIAIWIIHVYAAIWVRGTISAMTSGQVTAGWGWRHHRKWLRTEIAKSHDDKRIHPAE